MYRSSPGHRVARFHLTLILSISMALLSSAALAVPPEVSERTGSLVELFGVQLVSDASMHALIVGESPSEFGVVLQQDPALPTESAMLELRGLLPSTTYLVQRAESATSEPHATDSAGTLVLHEPLGDGSRSFFVKPLNSVIGDSPAVAETCAAPGAVDFQPCDDGRVSTYRSYCLGGRCVGPLDSDLDGIADGDDCFIGHSVRSESFPNATVLVDGSAQVDGLGLDGLVHFVSILGDMGQPLAQFPWVCSKALVLEGIVVEGATDGDHAFGVLAGLHLPPGTTNTAFMPVPGAPVSAVCVADVPVGVFDIEGHRLERTADCSSPDEDLIPCTSDCGPDCPTPSCVIDPSGSSLAISGLSHSSYCLCPVPGACLCIPLLDPGCIVDLDGDGWSGCFDCADDPSLDPAVCTTGVLDCSVSQYAPCAACVNPDAVEVCDGIDNNCSQIGQSPKICFEKCLEDMGGTTLGSIFLCAIMCAGAAFEYEYDAIDVPDSENVCTENICVGADAAGEPVIFEMEYVGKSCDSPDASIMDCVEMICDDSATCAAAFRPEGTVCATPLFSVLALLNWAEFGDAGVMWSEGRCDAAGGCVTCVMEKCNGADDDCDGEVDEGFKIGEPCDSIGGDNCPNGTWTCKADGSDHECINDTAEEYVELCNEVDDDCDGGTDEDFQNLGDKCKIDNFDNCYNGFFECTNDELDEECVGDEVGGIQEVCNDDDDDCDGLIDEGFPCCGKPDLADCWSAGKDGKCINESCYGYYYKCSTKLWSASDETCVYDGGALQYPCAGPIVGGPTSLECTWQTCSTDANVPEGSFLYVNFNFLVDKFCENCGIQGSPCWVDVFECQNGTCPGGQFHEIIDVHSVWQCNNGNPAGIVCAQSGKEGAVALPAGLSGNLRIGGFSNGFTTGSTTFLIPPDAP
jgi:hypothetical protein